MGSGVVDFAGGPELRGESPAGGRLADRSAAARTGCACLRSLRRSATGD